MAIEFAIFRRYDSGGDARGDRFDGHEYAALMGVLRQQPARFFWTAASGRVSRDAPSFKALMYLLSCMASKRTGVLGTKLQVWHEGRCGCCRKLLTVDSSIRSGFGPVCEARRAA